MQICRMDYNDVSADRRRLKLHVYGVGVFPVFSGVEPVTNIAQCAYKKNAALPVGTYWIVDRPSGSLRNRLQTLLRISRTAPIMMNGLASIAPVP
ncbi:hypothetical protein CLM71_06545 [Serratia sp. MYb239]|nr:hypothetical protein CLM71_06545 [Serratia sp. MYb239]CAE1143933.1 conserved protein of unknown function [Serratia sp. Tan611]